MTERLEGSRETQRECPSCGSPAKGTLWGPCSEDMYPTDPFHSTPAAPETPPDSRSDKDYAIEHGEYLAKAAERFQEAINEVAELVESADRDCDEELIDNAIQNRTDAWRGLASAIYEFRKRAKRVAVTPRKEEA